MHMHLQLTSVTPESPGFDALLQEAGDQGFPFLDRLHTEWLDGTNRFDRPGEALLGVYEDGVLVGVGGINRDPYAQTDDIGRLRHVYILRRARRRGAATVLVERLLADARGRFLVVRLRTDTLEAARFYSTIGFVPVTEESATHVRRLA
ncbi:GNAT family N-acetyltransferase [Dyella sp.]|uniref:GNAT family N-acetyltransferase n=1 Tax=Dyella sp. TaxID=1869338 RepID=UPI0039C874E4